MRITFFISSILYLPKNDLVMIVMKFNPIYFLAGGYRAAILHHEWFFITHWGLAIYNIILLFIIFVLGSTLHMYYRDSFADYV